MLLLLVLRYCLVLVWNVLVRRLAGARYRDPVPCDLLCAAYSPRALAMISLAIDSGTWLYAWNCIEYVARPCVRERRSVA